MTTPTYDLIESVTLTTAASSVTFSTIPQDYRDLVLVVEAKHTSINRALCFRLNGDTGANYNMVSMLGQGSSAISYANANQTLAFSETRVGTTVFANYIIQFFDFSQTDKHKSILIRGNRVDEAVSADAIRYANTTAMTSLILFPFSGDFASGATFNLYGIAA